MPVPPVELELGVPEAAAIAVPAEARQQPGWARAAAEDFGVRAGADADLVRRIEGALDDLVAMSTDDRRTMLLVSRPTGAIAPLTVFVSDAPLTERQQADFLWSPSAVLPPTPERTASENLGEGFSATLLQREGGRDFATRRWLFFGEDRTVGALLGPVMVPYALAVLAPLAELALAGSRVPGFAPADAEQRISELEQACARAGEAWAL